MKNKECKYWNYLKTILRANTVLYTTSNNFKYKFVEFAINRADAEVLKYAIPKRSGEGNNYKSIPSYVICAAYEDNQKGITINREWMRTHFLDLDNAGGCNIKVVESILKKYVF